MFKAIILPSLRVSPQKYQRTCLGYWQCLVPNSMPIDEVPAEKTMTEQKNGKKQTINLVGYPSHTLYGEITICNVSISPSQKKLELKA